MKILPINMVPIDIALKSSGGLATPANSAKTEEGSELESTQSIDDNADDHERSLAEAVGILVAGVLSEHSRRAYIGDIRHFLSYLSERELAVADVTKSVLVSYRALLACTYAPSTANRRL